MENFEMSMINKIDSGEKLTEKELRDLILNYGKESDEGENRRWSCTVTTIVELFGRTFAVEWERGLTEMQENEYYSQPYEVELKTSEKIVIVKEWVAINKDKQEG